MSSCLTIKDVKLFQDIPDSVKIANINLPKFTPPVIHPDDILSVTILTSDPTATLTINAINTIAPSTPVTGGMNGSSGGSNEGGYLVDKQGAIDMPILGKLNVGGLTIKQAQEVIRQKASGFFKDPLIIVKSKNLRITILGEVQRAGTYNATNEKVTIFDVLAYAGDFTPYARRDNILLLRQSDVSTLKPVRINLKNTAVLKSPYYYLQDNDVLIIEPNQGKAATSDAVFTRNISYISIGIGLLTTLLVLIKR